ncbi:hypothetical protein WMY93_005485 [Mugilogobius chulae]|uniref:AAA+ ATPase domain-containing protein n=1 Tax=Mugilogobius chulae TaxID=88201 RepID=A0AAW0PH67_9GOBI
MANQPDIVVVDKEQRRARGIVWKAQAEHNMESEFATLQQQWSERLLTVSRSPSSSARPQGNTESSPRLLWTVTDVEVHLAQIHFDSALLSTMLTSSYSEDFRAELGRWLHLLHELSNVLHLFKRLQQMWTFLTQMLDNTPTCLQSLFNSVDSKFRQVMERISRDPHVLLLLEDDLREVLTLGLSTMDAITTQAYSRLRFLSDNELIQMFPLLSLSTMLPVVRKLFRGVQKLECVDGDANLESQTTLGWLSAFDKQLHSSMVEHMKQCSSIKEQLRLSKQVIFSDGTLEVAKLSNDLTKQILHLSGLLAAQPSQCLQVMEEAMWCSIVENVFPHPGKVNKLKLYLKTRLTVLGHIIRDKKSVRFKLGWLVLDSVDLLSAKVSTTLGHFLTEIHESFSKITKENNSDKTVPASYTTAAFWFRQTHKCRTFHMISELLPRPVALTHPDYKFIVEVMLTSMGFVDAKYLSQRLVSLITFSKDYLFLPGCKTVNDTGIRSCAEFNRESAVCKSILSVLLPWTHELNKSQEFQQLLKETFPIACHFPSLEHYIEEREKDEVKAAILEALQINQVQPDAELISNALTVYQHLRTGKVVMLSGPSGSGKTSCYSMLAEGLNLLAMKSDKASTKLLLGHDCDDKGWQDGALSTFFRTCGNAEGVVNWLVLDGEEPRNQAEELSWMDMIGALYRSTGLCMGLASAEHLVPPPEHLRVLLEVSDLSTASPPALTACSLVSFTGVELWRAVWKTEMNRIYLNLDSVVERMWETLAEDLFPKTLHLLGQNSNSSQSESSRSPPVGLQEITSFIRILNAFVQHFEVCLEAQNPGDVKEPDSRGSFVILLHSSFQCRNSATLLARNCFLIAYVWGFGGHLHPSLWPRFQCVAREVLLRSRFQIQVPEGESVFEYFVTSDRRMCLQTTALTSHISPKYGMYMYLLNILLEARQPVLLVGEPGSGKTTVCRSVPTYKSPCVGLCGSAVLGPSDLVTVFRKATQPSSLLLFVDDLHQAVTDKVGATSPAALEVLRQSVSTGGLLLFSNSSLQLLNTGTVSYMCSSSVSDLTPTLSPRLSRLFSTFTLPALTPDTLLSLHAPRLQLWMQTLLPDVSEMASRIVSATHSLYLALQDHFKHKRDKNQFIFCVHDLQKVFQGMILWQSSSHIDPILDIVKLWLHECTHTFMDRLRDKSQNLDKIIVDVGAAHFGNILERSKTSDPVVKDVKVFMLDYIRNSDVVYSPELSAFLKTEPNSSQRMYKEMKLDVLTETLQNTLTDRHDSAPPEDFLRTYAVHRQRARQLAHILRVLCIPGAHALLLASSRGTGRRSTARCAAALSGADLLEVHGADQRELSVVLRRASDRSRVRGVRVLLLVHADVSVEVRERLLLVMSQAAPGLHTQEQIERRVVTVTSSGMSQRFHLDQWMLDKFLGQTHKNIHIVMLLPHSSSEPGLHSSTLFTTQMRRALKSSCCVEFYQPWSFQSLLSTAELCLQTGAYAGEYVSSVAQALSRIHLCACQYASSLLPFQPFSPASFLGCLKHFCELFKVLQSKALRQTKRMSAVVSSLEELSSMALERLQSQRNKLQAIQKEEEAVLRSLSEQERRLQDALNTSVLEEARLVQLEEDIQELQLKVQADVRFCVRADVRFCVQVQADVRFRVQADVRFCVRADVRFRVRADVRFCVQVKAAGEAAVRKVTSLELCALEEVRLYRDPPEPVVMVLDAVCVLFHEPPGWDSAKHLLCRDNFFQLQQLASLVHSPAFDPQLVREASQACQSLCLWVLAVYECCRLQKHVDKSRRLETQAKATRERLHEVRRQKEDACSQLKKLRVKLASVQEQLHKQISELQHAEQVHRETTCTVDKLGAYVCVWKENAQEDTQVDLLMSVSYNYMCVCVEGGHTGGGSDLTAVPGDSLLTAAVVSYLGPFGPDTRCELLTKWRGLCETGRMCCKPEDPRRPQCCPNGSGSAPLLPISVLSQGPLARALGVSERTENSLSSLLIPLLLKSCEHKSVHLCPLLVDPHHRLDNALSSSSSLSSPLSPLSLTAASEVSRPGMWALKDFEMELCADDPDLLDQLEQATVTGARVLVRAAERSPSCPRLLSILSHCHSRFSLTFSTTVPVHLLTTEMPEPVLSRLQVLDLSLSSEELEDLIQTHVLPPESSVLLKQQPQLEQSREH